VCTPHRNRFKFLVSPDHAVTGSPSLAAIISDVCITYQILTTRTNGAGADLFVAKFYADSFFGFVRAFAEQVGGIVELHTIIIDKKLRPFVTTIM